MSQEKYIGMDVHQASISVAVMDAQGKLIMEKPAGDQSEQRSSSSSKGCRELCRLLSKKERPLPGYTIF